MKSMKKISLCVAACLLLLSGCGQVVDVQKRTSESGQAGMEQLEISEPEQFDTETAKTTIPDYVAFFAEDKVHDLYVEISDEDWQTILGDPTGQEYCCVTVSVDDITLDDVGFRTREGGVLNCVWLFADIPRGILSV